MQIFWAKIDLLIDFIYEYVENLDCDFQINSQSNSQIVNSEFSIIKENNQYKSSPRSHG